MPSDSFSFKRFKIFQDQCAMKVGTDGVLLGAWASGGRRILDVGTGTGLIALMMAQRFENAEVTGIEIDGTAARQASQNSLNSPFAERVRIREIALRDFYEECKEKGQKFDSIVCNPPFYENSLGSKNISRTLARSTETLPFSELMACCGKLLSGLQATLSLIIPVEARSRMEQEAALVMLRLSRTCLVRTKQSKPPKRCLMEFSPNPKTFSSKDLVIGSEEYKDLTREFYL